MMQFLWRFVDEMVGKGLSMDVMGQFFYYASLALVPNALPLAILLASLITFGNFGERYELLAMKAAGISLIEIMRPLIVLATALCFVSFLFQNVIAPNAQLKLYTLMYSVQQKSPELNIPEKVFFDQLPGYNIYIQKKNRETGMMYDVMIYNISEGFENTMTLYADSASMEPTADQGFIYLHMYDGESFQNQKSQNSKSEYMPYRREIFREKHMLVEYESGFQMMDEDIMSNRANSKNMSMIEASIDSMNVLNDSVSRKYFQEAMTGVYQTAANLSKDDTLKIQSAAIEDYNVDSLFNRSTLAQKQKILSTATSRVENQASDWNYKSFTIKANDAQIRRHWTEWHRKFTYSLSCLIFFFIGAPLGSIIRKGGLGMPVVMSVLIFIFYYIIDNMGYKMARDGHWIMVAGMWLSTVVLAPIGAFLTYKSNNDSVVFNIDAYISWLKQFIGIRSVRHIVHKEVIIHDPDYNRLVGELNLLTAECQSYIEANRLTKAPNYFKLWVTEKQDKKINQINEQLEAMIEEMANAHSYTILNLLNNYPIIPNGAHTKPFKIQWLNYITGLVFPVGLFFYIRIWIFRLRLQKDLSQVITTNQNIVNLIQNNKL